MDATNKIVIKGIFSQGYGTISRLVMRDRTLSPEAKAIYAYIASFAGSGTTAFPSTSIMLAELDMGKARFFKHRNLLIEKGYITVHHTRCNGRQGANIYELNLVPNSKPTCGKDVENAKKKMSSFKNKNTTATSRKNKKGNLRYKVIYKDFKLHKDRITPVFKDLTGRKPNKQEIECMYRVVNRLNVNAKSPDEAYKLLEKALDIALAKNMLKMQYVTGICNNFINNGFTCLNDYSMDEMERKLNRYNDNS